MQQTCLISVIIPVYNAQHSIKKCINSILVQKFQNYEIIIIDDGSTDDSMSLIEASCALDKRCRCFHQPNSGVSSARNFGLTLASGQYICFIDADDYVSEDYLDILYQNRSDLVLGGYRRFGDVCNECLCKERIIDKEEIHSILASCLEDELYRTPWAKMFKTSVIKDYNIKFDKALKLGEDTCFVQNYLCHINSISIVQQTGYHYYVTRRSVKYNFSETDLVNTVLKLENSYFNLSRKWKFENIHYLNSIVYKIPLLMYLFTQKGANYSFSHSGYHAFKKAVQFVSRKVSTYCFNELVDLILLMAKYKLSILVFLFVGFVWPLYVKIKVH